MHETPNDIEQIFQRAAELHRQGLAEDAETLYLDLLKLQPTHVSALTNLGVLQAARGETEKAVHSLTAAVGINPKYADAHYNLGNVYRRAGALEFAAECYRECLRLAPAHENASFNLGLTAKAAGDFPVAEAAFRAVLVTSPTDLPARQQLGEVLARQSKHAEAVAELGRAVADHPASARAYCNLGVLLLGMQRFKEAQPSLQTALKLQPEYPEAHNAYGLVLQSLGRFDDALYHFQQAVTAHPKFEEAWNNWAINLAEQGMIAEAVDCLNTAIERGAGSPALHDNRLVLLFSLPGTTPDILKHEHEAWAERFAPRIPAAPAIHPPPDAKRRLRVGYVSADFREHSVAGMVETLFRNHDRSGFEVFAYSNVGRPDDTTRRLQSSADHWRHIREMNEGQFAGCVRSDGIDVLVDLAGHLAGNRLLGFALRPAAVQLSLYGYPGTTGLKAIDARITDAVSDPPGATEEHWTERLIRLPDVGWVYSPPAEAPPVSPLPAAQAKSFTFGCLANSIKLGPECVAAWAELIRSAPGSKLVLLSGSSQMAKKVLLERFAKVGILRERIAFVERMPRGKYLETLGTFDLALDPFPFNGCTTTADALWMGVPVLTVAGRSSHSRQGAMAMYALGLAEFVADSPDALPALGKMWMGRRNELAQIRAGLRQRMKDSALCAGERYTRNLEDAFRSAWIARVDEIPGPRSDVPDDSQ
jgi:predicted O-linked N-acetylglucosamine transferase (SPINDLY family)